MSRVGAALFAGTALVEAGFAAQRWRARADGYAAAVKRAASLGRPLVVIGDPDAGAHTRLMRAYGCGDICVDLNGCPRCDSVRPADITKGPVPGIADDSVVVFVSCVLEYVSDVDAALQEIQRMAGDRANVFVVLVQPWTFTAWLYPGARWVGSSDGDTIHLRPVTGAHKVTAAGALAALVALTIWGNS
jgi:hypothetical protein